MGQTLLSHLLIFYARANPNIGGPISFPGGDTLNIVWSLRQKKPVEIGRVTDKLPQPNAFTIQISATLKHISHACTKHSVTLPRTSSFLIPFERFAPVEITKKAARRVRLPEAMPHPFCP